MNPQKTYISILKILRKRYGNKATTDTQLTRIGKKYFNNVYIGTYPWDTYPLSNLPEYGFAIINTDDSKKGGTHWVAIHNYKNKMYVYDSFGRITKNILKKFNKRITGKGLKIIDSRRDPEQQGYQEDCGLRCIAWLLIIKSMGIKKALEI